MAGNYPDVPGYRMAYDVDGTQGFWTNAGYTGMVAQATSGDLVAMNDENIGTNWPPTGAFSSSSVVLIFPELRDLDGLYLAYTEGFLGITGVQVSTNTTNGIDGTWTSYPIPPGSTTVDTVTKMRTAIMANTALGIKAIRWTWTSSGGGTTSRTSSAHLYGEPAPGENLQRLEIWHPTLDQKASEAYFDWGNVPRGSTEIRQFRVKNMHGTLTANSVRAAMSILTDTSPSVVGQMAISKDGTSYASQQTLTSPLGPGAISPVLYLRRTTPTNATLSLWWHRLFADCSSWT